MDKNLPANAGNRGSIPGRRRSHTPRNNKAQPLIEACALQMLGSAVREATSTACPLLSQLEKALVQQQRLSTTKNKYINNFFEVQESIQKTLEK